MIVNILYFVLIVLYSVYIMFRSNTLQEIIKLIISLVAFLTAIGLNNIIASFIANNISFLWLANDVDLIMGMEVIYYKVSAFIIVFLLTYIVLLSFTNILNLSKKLSVYDRKWLRFIVALVNGYIFFTICLSLFLATPFSLEYANDLTYTLSEVVGIGSLMNLCSYDYVSLQNILVENSHLISDDINIAVLAQLEAEGYATKSQMADILANSKSITDGISEWLNN